MLTWVLLAASCCCSRTNCSSADAVAAALAGPDAPEAAAAAAAASAARTRSSSCSICGQQKHVCARHIYCCGASQHIAGSNLGNMQRANIVCSQAYQSLQRKLNIKPCAMQTDTHDHTKLCIPACVLTLLPVLRAAVNPPGPSVLLLGTPLGTQHGHLLQQNTCSPYMH